MDQMHLNRNGLRPAAARPGPITQRMLSEYVALGEQVRRHRELRQRLMDLLAAGAGVEPGPLAADVRTVRSKRLSVAKLSALIGAENVQIFLEAIEPTEAHRLDVSPAPGRAEPRSVGRTKPPRKGRSGLGAGLSFR